jgi:formylglycine-generating enzyme required for sulfatase activity
MRTTFAYLLATLLFAGLSAQAAETRALKIIATDSATKQTGEVTLYNKSVAVIIGIDQYANLPADKQLTYAVKDAKGVADVLKRQYKFDKIITLYNKEATRDRILDLLTEELPAQLGEQDALFIFWAGHGNQESSREGDLGYLIPYDGDIKKIRTNVSMIEIRDTVSKKIPAKHIFYVMDACYSGMLTDTRSVDKTPRRDLAYLQDITKERVRQVLTAGGKNQEVLDGGNNGHSVFTGRLIELLERTGDFITANEIQAIIKEKVNGDARARNHNQTPSYGTLYGTGDFVFIPSLEQKVADNKAEIAKLEAEQKDWEAKQAAAKLAGNQAEMDRLKREADLAKNAIAGKLKAEQLKKDQLAAEEKRRQDEEAERQRLMAAKGEDDKRLAALKAAADVRRKANTPQTTASDFPTVESAAAEIKRLNQQINSIEAGYEKELAQTRAKVTQRYAAQLAAVNNAQRDEFETPEEFNAKQSKQRNDLNRQRDAELSRLTATGLSAAETQPLRDSIRTLAEREYSIGTESIAAELSAYDAVAKEFTIILKSKTPNIKLALNGSIPLPLAEAKAFKQQWVAGLVRLEGKVKAGSDNIEIALANDADNMRFTYLGGAFLTPKMKQEREEQAYRPEMVKIPAAQPFFMAKTEVTQGQWRAVMGNNPSNFSGCDNCPVEQVSWDDIQTYLQKLNAKTGKQYRLPTETEWEIACYGGNKTEYCGGNDAGSVAWFADNSGSKTHPVGQKQANGYGLYDMSGNVWEWMSDCYNGDCGRRVFRGGSWGNGASNLRAAFRFGNSPGSRANGIGFRVARTLP